MTIATLEADKLYRLGEVAYMVGVSTQTLILWDKHSVKEVANGGERYIPEPTRVGVRGDRYWKGEDIEKLIEFKANMTFRTFGKYNNRAYYNKKGE